MPVLDANQAVAAARTHWPCRTLGQITLDAKYNGGGVWYVYSLAYEAGIGRSFEALLNERTGSWVPTHLPRGC